MAFVTESLPFELAFVIALRSFALFTGNNQPLFDQKFTNHFCFCFLIERLGLLIYSTKLIEVHRKKNLVHRKIRDQNLIRKDQMVANMKNLN